MKVIFLDFDGVMNSERWAKERHAANPLDVSFMRDNLDMEAVARVEAIAKATGAKVVISSTWRLIYSLDRLRNLLADHGLSAEVIDKTPRLGTHRGIEIAHWLNSHGPVESFVILDDDADMAHLMHRLVQTSWMTGIEDHHIQQAIDMLNKPITRDAEELQEDPNWRRCVCDWEDGERVLNAICTAHE